jgi:hypothetical protein
MTSTVSFFVLFRYLLILDHIDDWHFIAKNIGEYFASETELFGKYFF